MLRVWECHGFGSKFGSLSSRTELRRRCEGVPVGSWTEIQVKVTPDLPRRGTTTVSVSTGDEGYAGTHGPTSRFPTSVR